MTAELDTLEPRSDESDTRNQLAVRVWGSDATQAQQALDDGYEIWVGIDDGSGLELQGTQGFAVVFAAFDDAHRIAGVGYGAAQNFTIPVAQAAAATTADTARSYFETLIEP